MRTVLLALAAFCLASAAPAQSTSKKKSGLPDPPKKDVAYLIHADLLLETEISQAKEETRKDELAYSIPGAASPVKTPLSSPEFLFQAESIVPEKLAVFKLESKNGRRDVVVSRKKKPVGRPIQISVFRVHERVFKIRVDDILAPGEYSLSPDGSNAVFCFAVE